MPSINQSTVAQGAHRPLLEVSSYTSEAAAKFSWMTPFFGGKVL
jgi:hypothetical protein